MIFVTTLNIFYSLSESPWPPELCCHFNPISLSSYDLSDSLPTPPLPANTPPFSKVRTMKLVWASEDGKEETERTVCQFHYSAWPDHGIPTQVKPLLEMVRLIRDCQVGRHGGDVEARDRIKAIALVLKAATRAGEDVGGHHEKGEEI